MPPPKKIDRMPEALRARLATTLTEAGFGDIVRITEDLNFWLEDEGLELRIGKSAVGEFSQALKNQREAFQLAETLLDDMDIERESDMHKVLMQMIATAAVQYMKTMVDQEALVEPKDLMNLGRMLKDVMASMGIREKIRDDERQRVAKETATKAAGAAEKVVRGAGLSEETVEAVKSSILGITA